MSFSSKIGNSEIKGDFSKLDKLIKELSKNKYVDVGIIGKGSYEGGATIAGIGAVHEFGTNKAGRGNKTKIPERSFIRMPLETGQEQIEEQMKPIIEKSFASANIEGMLVKVGIACEARIQEAFETGGFGKWPALQAVTIDKKGSSSILIDEGTLRKSITSRVGG